MSDRALPPLLLSLRRLSSGEDPQALTRLQKGLSRFGPAELGLLTFSEPASLRILQAAGLQRQTHGITLVAPNMSQYLRDVAHLGLAGAAQKNLRGASAYAWARTVATALPRVGPLLQKDLRAMVLCICQYEICRLKLFALKAVFLHPQLTDVALALGNGRILLEFIALVKSHPALVPGLATANYCLAESRLKEWGIENTPILTPVNPAGFLMKPNRDSCERCLRQTHRPIVADKIRVEAPLRRDFSGLAAGAAKTVADETVADSFRYLESFAAIRSAAIELADWTGETFHPKKGRQE